MTAAPAATAWRPWAVWGLAVTAYAVAVFQRGSLAVSSLDFQHRFHAGAADLSLLAVLQLAVYAAMQVPVGLLLDRVGPRLLIATGAVVMGGGQALMAYTHLVPEAVAARVLIGAGDAMTFISALRVINAWFPPRRVPLLTQLTGILGQLGQVVAAYPLVALLRDAGWSASFTAAAVASGVVSLAVLAGLRETPDGRPARVRTPGAMRLGLQESWREHGTRMGLWTHFVNQFSGTVFALLWGYPFLVDGEKVSASVAGALLSGMVLVGMGVGPALGGLAGQWPLRRSALTLIIVGATTAMWTAVLLWPARAPLPLLILLVLVLSANGPGSLLGFDYARTYNPSTRMGAASGIVNMGGFVASLVTILCIGLVLGAAGDSSPSHYTLNGFRLAFLVQYPMWAFGLWQVLRTRRTLRARRAAEQGVVVDPLHRAVARRLADRSRRGL
jgi:MFS family permease